MLHCKSTCIHLCIPCKFIQSCFLQTEVSMGASCRSERPLLPGEIDKLSFDEAGIRRGRAPGFRAAQNLCWAPVYTHVTMCIIYGGLHKWGYPKMDGF